MRSLDERVIHHRRFEFRERVHIDNYRGMHVGSVRWYGVMATGTETIYTECHDKRGKTDAGRWPLSLWQRAHDTGEATEIPAATLEGVVSAAYRIIHNAATPSN